LTGGPRLHYNEVVGCVPSRITLGIDEAGRGPVIGPMVMAAVGLETRAAAALTRAGLRDSKSYGAGPEARARRAALAARVRRLACHFEIRVIDVAEIDRRVARGELNVLEREVATSFIEAAPPVDRLVADGRTLFAPLASRFPSIEAHNHGESVHAAVAAASILAKHRRDQIFARIAERYRGEFGPVDGGGYVNARTRAFLRRYVERYRRLPPEARRSWPHRYLEDLLGPHYDPFAELGETRPGQLAIFA
jgi:ribonuclease HII